MEKRILIMTLLLSSFLSAQKWESDWTAAAALAKQNHQNVLLVFSGSDWCAPCIRLDKSIWQSSEFQDYAKDHWTMLRADFPRKKANQLPEDQKIKNAQLAEKYNKNGYFPLVLLLDPNGNILGQTGFKNISVQEYIALLKSFEG
ncbi:thioredoxin family protein [Arenibacter sp. M-2]|uniref:thioredoxin family protein n=1 Tax=Arenibacter sp. M-2 TaxID=3053612 RepID=UPI002570B0C3|nr:thioredoxin family protein [Arenibacter sp. M-2]MDL5513348.1 thioredoxin family protein [Arenibacter sp. M-2]|tara:strand:+ start:26066 stop:26500 length:435 start_codon:yes stop_codon:yes gene_type:complete